MKNRDMLCIHFVQTVISGQGFGDPDTKYCFRSETAFKQGSFSHLKLLETNNFDPGMEPASSAAPALADGFFTT